MTNPAAVGVDYAATGESLQLFFMPDPDYNGMTNFDFQAKDDAGLIDPTAATATITVNAVNDAPVANDDNFTVDEDDALTLPLDVLLQK